jgi:Tol biopolymer transport system component
MQVSQLDRVTLVLFLVLVACTPTATGTADKGDRIAYRELDGSLWSMKLDGTDRRLVHRPADTASSGLDSRFMWSPDGTRIAFVNGTNLLLADLRTSVTKKVHEGSITVGPFWNSQGSSLAFGEGASVRILQLESGQVITVGDDIWDGVSLNDPAANIAWTLDGKIIVYRKNGGIAVVPSDGSQSPRIIVPRGQFFALSPDGQYLAYEIFNDGFWIVNASCLSVEATTDCTSGARLLSSNDAPFRMRWSPDSARIVGIYGASQLQIFDMRSGDHTILNTGGSSWYETNPWSPDGRRLVISHLRGGGETPSSLHIYDFETRRTEAIPGFENGFPKAGWEASWGPRTQER